MDLSAFGKIGAVAPVLPVAEEEHLDAELPRLLVEGEDIRLLDRLRVDALHALNRRERRQAVAAARGALELELLGRLLHLVGDALLHGVGLARKEGPRLGGEFRVILGRDLARAGA